jgi:ubiquinone/menaquinone biosynthesis C-methylase UbiE
MSTDAVTIQRSYYAATAERYDEMHVRENDEHAFALRFLTSVVEHFGIGSILDIGSGTGRGLIQIRKAMPHAKALGIEPCAELRQIGYAKGLSERELIDGDATDLAFPDNSFDLVCEFGALHHIPDPNKAVSEMLRVARRAIFISDMNNFGHGSGLAKLLKQAINAAGLWKAAGRLHQNKRQRLHAQ